MKRFLSLVATALLIAPGVAAVAQQGTTVAYGRTTIRFSDAFQQNLSNLGATLTDLNLHPYVSGVAVFPITEGVVDLQSAQGELSTSGGYAISAGGATIVVQNLVTDLSNPGAPVITGLFVINGIVLGRQQVFNLIPPANFSLPLQPQNGVEQATGFQINLAAQTAATINGLFGAQILAPGTPMGSADFYAVLAASGGIY